MAPVTPIAASPNNAFQRAREKRRAAEGER